jgi:hypothetical protein
LLWICSGEVGLQVGGSVALAGGGRMRWRRLRSPGGLGCNSGRNSCFSFSLRWNQRRWHSGCHRLCWRHRCGVVFSTFCGLLWRETSDPWDRVMEALLCLSPPWGHRLGADLSLGLERFGLLLRLLVGGASCSLATMMWRAKLSVAA